MSRPVRMYPPRPSLIVSPVILVLALLIQASALQAQTSNPNIVEFVPSQHHSAMLSSGQPVVSHYQLTFYEAGTTQSILTFGIGKPALQADGLIRVDFTSRITSWPASGKQVEARVSAIGPEGTATSNPSNTFVYNSAPASNTPPTVRITRPAANSQVKTAPPLRITADASDRDDGIAKVDFYANGAHIGTATSAPYNVKWKLPSNGTYTLTAVAEDTRGARTTSSPVSVTGRK